MTREEWIEEMDSLSALIDWCRDNAECEDVFDDFIYEDSLDEYIAEDIRNFDWGWDDLRDNLNNISTGYPWYRVDGSFDYVGFHEYDYDEFKETVLECLDEEGYFEDEDEDEEPETTVRHAEPIQQEIEIEVPDEPEIDAVDLDSFDTMSTVIWGITQDIIEPHQEPADVNEEDNKTTCYATYWRDVAEQDDSITPVDLTAIPF